MKNKPTPDLSRVRIIMVGCTHPGNIGAAARAMKTMGLNRLFLVRPLDYPSAQATARAAGADDVLDEAISCESLAQAGGDCKQMLATTARRREISCPVLSPRQAAAHWAQTGDESALVFGPEHSGLTNDDVALCQYAIHIPTVSHFRSLNVASAIQILSYEFAMAAKTQMTTEPPKPQTVPTRADMEQFYEHLSQCLTRIEFTQPQKYKRLHRRLRRLFDRAAPDMDELSLLHGILSAAERGHPPEQDDH